MYAFIALAWCVLNVNISVQKAHNILQNDNVKKKLTIIKETQKSARSWN